MLDGLISTTGPQLLGCLRVLVKGQPVLDPTRQMQNIISHLFDRDTSLLLYIDNLLLHIRLSVTDIRSLVVEIDGRG